MGELYNFYLRLLTYSESIEFIDFMKNLGGYNYANIVVGGVNCTVEENSFNQVIDYLDTKVNKYEINVETPTNTVNKIIETLKLKNNK